MISKENRLSNRFFRENPLQRISSAVIAHYMMTDLYEEEMNQTFDELVSDNIDAQRRESLEQERVRIEQTNDPEMLVEIARKGHDIFNRNLLCEKLLMLHEQTVPLLLRRYRTCTLDSLIETAMTVFATGEEDNARLLLEMYPEIRCPYAQACACLVFGMQGMEDTIPLLLREYERLGKEYPAESWDQHPLLALYILHERY